MRSDCDLQGSKLDKEAFQGWQCYPSNIDADIAAFNLQTYAERLSDLRSELFCESSAETDLEIIDIDLGPSTQASRNCFRTSGAVDHYLLESPAYATRIITFHSQNSLEPLKVTEESFRKILTCHEIGPEFLDLIFAFGAKPKDSEAGLGCLTVKHRSDGSYDMCYLMVYAEENRGKEKTSWPVRQTAVFNRFKPNSEGNLWIIVNPMPNAVLAQRLESLITERTQLEKDRYMQKLHLLSISSYIESSRWYLKALSEEFEDIADVALTLDFSRPNDYTDGFRTLTKLQYLQERILPLSARFETSRTTIAELQRMNNMYHEESSYTEELSKAMSNGYSLYHSKYQGYINGVDLLRSRVQGIIKLLSVALNLKNQATAVDINHNMLLLTKDTVDDSATVRVVTLVTLIYLPASFVSSLLGMNLFAFQSADSSDFQVSRQFWVFIVLTVPLTILTVGSWFYISHVRRRNKTLQDRMQKQQRPGIEV